MVAGAPTDDLARPAGEIVEVARGGTASGHATSRLGNRAETEDARTTLAGALAGHVVQDSRGRPDAAALGRQEPDQPAAEAQPPVRQEGWIEGQVTEVLDRRPATEIAAKEHGLDLFRCAARALDDLGERRPVVDLANPGKGDRAADGDEGGPARGPAAGRPIPVFSVAGDERGMSQALDVLDELARPATPRSRGCGGLTVGRASCELMKFTTADDSPEM
jgi:hypothetical protein